MLGLVTLMGAVMTGCTESSEQSGTKTVEESIAENDSQVQDTTETENITTASDEEEAKVENDMNRTYTVEEAAYESFTSFIDGYYFKSSVSDYGLFLEVDKKEMHFWDQAEIYEVVIDAYERTGDKRYYDMIFEIFKGFTRTHGTDWEWNEYNDDIMWMTIACTRAYNDTGDKDFLDIAVKHFDMVWDRAWTDDLGGGLWWRTDNNTKNACVNCPATIAACLLGDALDDESYYDKAKLIMDWVVGNIYDSKTGNVYDAYNIKGEKNSWASTYNQGTFIGANTLLYLHTGDGAYLSQARRAADYTIENMYNYGVMNNEDNTNDLIGFKGILTRWMYCFAVNCDQKDVMDWLKTNAMTAWSNRNTDGIMATSWDTKTPDGAQVKTFGASTAVAALHNCKESGKTSLQANDFNKASAFDRCGRMWIVGGGEDLKLETFAENAFIEYACMKFAEESTKAKITAGAETETKMEIRLGAPDGELAATVTIAAGTMDTPREIEAEVQGLKDTKQKVYFVFPEGGTKVKVSGFQFGS